MKTFLKNNYGYSLLITLLTIAVFTIVSLSFFVQSASSKKQNDKIEERSQSVAIAEMGSQFYSNAIKSEFNNIKSIAQKAYNHEMSKENSKIEDAKAKGIEAAYNELKLKLSDSGINNRRKINETSSEYIISDISSSIDSNNIVKIHFKSTGDIPSLSNPTTISGEIELDLNNLFIIESEDEENLCKSNKITCRDDEGALIIEVDKTNSFNPDNFKDLLAKYTTIYIFGDLYTGNNNNVINNKKIYINGNATFTNNLNKTENSFILVTGFLEFLNMKGNSKNVIICAQEGIKYHNIDTEEVTIYQKKVDGVCTNTSPNIEKPPVDDEEDTNTPVNSGNLIIKEEYTY